MAASCRNWRGRHPLDRRGSPSAVALAASESGRHAPSRCPSPPAQVTRQPLRRAWRHAPMQWHLPLAAGKRRCRLGTRAFLDPPVAVAVADTHCAPQPANRLWSLPSALHDSFCEAPPPLFGPPLLRVERRVCGHRRPPLLHAYTCMYKHTFVQAAQELALGRAHTTRYRALALCSVLSRLVVVVVAALSADLRSQLEAHGQRAINGC